MSKAYITFGQPKSCHDCPCFNDHAGECRAAGKELNTNLEIPEWCPVKGGVILSERLTKRIDNVPSGKPSAWVKNHDYTSAIEKLADYEDLEEQGLLSRLPCKVGDKAIDELCCKLTTYFADCQLIEERQVIRDVLGEVIERIDEIAERMKEVKK